MSVDDISIMCCCLGCHLTFHGHVTSQVTWTFDL